MDSKLLKIFIVEDDDSITNLYKQVFQLNGYFTMGTASNGEEAVRKYKNFNEKPDLIIMDHRMPYKNGLEAMTDILKMNDTSLILFVSADYSIEKEALSNGASGFLQKPFSIEEIIKNIEDILMNNK